MISRIIVSIIRWWTTVPCAMPRCRERVSTRSRHGRVDSYCGDCLYRIDKNWLKKKLGEDQSWW